MSAPNMVDFLPFVQIAANFLAQIPSLISSIQASAALSAEEKKHMLELLEGNLNVIAAQVANVKIMNAAEVDALVRARSLPAGNTP